MVSCANNTFLDMKQLYKELETKNCRKKGIVRELIRLKFNTMLRVVGFAASQRTLHLPTF